MAEQIKEPCKDLLWKSSVSDRTGQGRADVMRNEPDVWQQIHYGLPFRLAKGYAILRGGQV